MTKMQMKVSPGHALAQNELLDALKASHYARNDAHLSRILGESVVVISRLRHGTAVFGPAMAIRVLDKGILQIRDLRALLPMDHPFNMKGKK